jgi:hypothetical protein
VFRGQRVERVTSRAMGPWLLAVSLGLLLLEVALRRMPTIEAEAIRQRMKSLKNRLFGAQAEAPVEDGTASALTALRAQRTKNVIGDPVKFAQATTVVTTAVVKPEAKVPNVAKPAATTSEPSREGGAESSLDALVARKRGRTK